MISELISATNFCVIERIVCLSAGEMGGAARRVYRVASLAGAVGVMLMTRPIRRGHQRLKRTLI